MIGVDLWLNNYLIFMALFYCLLFFVSNFALTQHRSISQVFNSSIASARAAL